MLAKFSYSILGRILLGSSIGALALGSMAQAQDLKEVNVITPNDSSCGLYPQWNATHFGFWADNGIKVNILPSETDLPYVAYLQNGDADIVALDSAEVLHAAESDLPIKVIYEATQYAPEGIFVKADSSIQGLQDLKDVTIGLASDFDLITTIIAMSSIGASLDDNNITTVVVGDSGPVMAGALRDDTIDAFVGSSSDFAAISAAGIQIRDITPPEVSRTPGISFAVWGPTLEEKRELIEAFVNGWAQAQHAGILDTKTTASACATSIPEQFENREVGMNLVATNAYTQQVRRTKNYGELQPDVWASIQPAYINVGEISKKVNPDTFLDASFIDAANNWRTDQVKAGIESWKEGNPDLVVNGGGPPRTGRSTIRVEPEGETLNWTKTDARPASLDTPEPDRIFYWWNAWADPLPEDAGIVAPSFKPVDSLEPDHSYLLSVHLSGAKYNVPGVLAFEVERRLRKALEEARKTPVVKDLTFQVVLLTDERAFTTPSQVLGELKVDIEKIRAFASSGHMGGVDPMADLESGADPEYLFARLKEVELKTTSATGPAAVGLSFWLRGRPYAELSIPFCVREAKDPPCEEALAPITSLGGSGLLDAAGDTVDTPLPDAALHVVELSPKTLVGVYHRAEDPNVPPDVESHLVWPIEGSAQEFIDQLALLQEQFGKVQRDPITVGKDFKDLLFGGDGDDVNQARIAFETFFASQRSERPFSNPDPGTFFVRMILQNLPRPWLYPLGLINVDGKEDGFLGFHLRVETPLPRQSYGRTSTCLGTWVPVLPVESQDGPLNEALREISNNRLSQSFFTPVTRYQVVSGRPPVEVHPNMKQFHDWINQKNSPTEPVILSVLSHHDSQSLYFRTDQTHINPSSVQRSLGGSVAILSGCSTGKLGSAGIVRKLNDRGADAIISTNTGITGGLAGDFIECISRTLEREPSGGSLPVGIAFSRAQRCLYGENLTEEAEPRSLYGHLVLSFTLSGNPNLSLCGPE